MKQVQVVIPYDKVEGVLDFVLDVINVKNVIKFNADNAIILQFRINDDAVLEILSRLKSQGVGLDFGFIDIIDLRTSLPRETEEPEDRLRHREAALAVEEIYENVKKQSSLSFDFIAFVILSAFMAGFGLIQNNSTIIVASMLLSPLMGPILGVAFGYVISDKKLFVKGTRNELIALLLSFAVGSLIAALVPLLDPELLTRVSANLDAGIATEITRRGGFNILDIGIAVFSGAAVAVSITKGDMSSLVGVAISAALMPPAVNVGMMIVLGLISGVTEITMVGVGSFYLLIMNIVLIDIAAIIMFRIKKLAPIADKSARWTAVTLYRRSNSNSLYHTRPEPKAADTVAPASFRPAHSQTAAENNRVKEVGVADEDVEETVQEADEG